jgi:Ca2+-binding RTX toxin-like protein
VRGGEILPEPWLRQTLSGTEGDDLLSGGAAGADLILGGGGNDRLAGGGGDTLDGGAGDDLALFDFNLSEAAFFREGDLLRVSRAGMAEAVTLISVEALAFADQVAPAADVPLSGGAGDDLIVGGAGADALFGGAGDDTLVGGGGADFLDGGPGGDTARFAAAFSGAGFGRDGAALLVTIAGVTTRLVDIEYLAFDDRTVTTLPQQLTGAALDDLLEGALGDDAIEGGEGNDTLLGGPGNDTLDGGADDDWLVGGGGDDLLIGGAGANLLDGGAGQDRARFDFAVEGAVVLALESGGLAISAVGALDQTIVIDIEALEFTNVTLTPEQALALSGGMVLNGGPGGDTLEGDGGNDLLSGGGGNDILRGNGGADTLMGGDGADTLNGGDGDDSIIGGATEADRRDVVFAGAGNDFVDSGFGNDELNGMEGDDALQGWFGSDTVIGGLGNDVVNGGPGSDLIFGGPGSDFVNGGFGHDRINGGTGADRFFHLGIFDHGSDWVQDFTHTEGDVLIFGQAGATADQFHVNTASIAGDAAVEEAFVVFRPTGQIIWALVDGMENASINLRIAGSGDVFDLLA